MFANKKMTRKCYIIANIVFALIFVNTLLFGGYLKAGESFTAGFLAGFGVAWLAFIVFGWIEVRKPGAMMDERQAAHLAKASSLAFWITVLAACVLQIILRSEALAVSLPAAEAVAIVANLGLATLGLSWFVISRRG